MKEQKWSKNVILVDADYVDKVAFDLIVNFERMLGRRIPQADTARWLECVALDGGLRPQPSQLSLQPSALTPQPSHLSLQPSIQVVFIHQKPAMDNFLPGSFAELDGKAFTGELGEFLVSCVPVEQMTTTDDLFLDSLQVVSNAQEVERLMIVPNEDTTFNKVREGLRHANPDLRATVFTMQPQQGGPFRQEILGYSLMAALGIKAEEVTSPGLP
jgi:hypothetical protein